MAGEIKTTGTIAGLVNVFELYADTAKQADLEALLTAGAQQHPLGLAASFLEKDIWVTEILRLLYNEDLLGGLTVAFKGGTALSKCWRAIGRFSEDIDLSIHWADLADAEDEEEAWLATTATNSQLKKFRDKQSKRLIRWSTDFVNRLNQRLNVFAINRLKAKLIETSKGEQITISFPRVAVGENPYQLDYLLLEFGGRNRGRPTQPMPITCYLAEIPQLKDIAFPTATVNAYDLDYILWEKLTALHQFSTQTKRLAAHRIARHWYDVDCLLNEKQIDPLANRQAMLDVITMKSARWAVPGVDYQAILQGKLVLVPEGDALTGLKADHQEAVRGGMFFETPDEFEEIVRRLKTAEEKINDVGVAG